jgi:DnaJ family protein C protein 7
MILIADRHASNTPEVLKEQEKAFKDVGEAYEVLSDSKKRFRYDQGQDLMDAGGSSGGGYYDPYDANQIFNMFFSTGSMGGGGMGGHPGHGHSRTGHAGGARYYSSNARGGGGGGGCSFNSQR